jgi:hypothetical protein
VAASPVATMAEEIVEEFLHGQGSMSSVRCSSSQWKEEDRVRGGASHRSMESLVAGG